MMLRARQAIFTKSRGGIPHGNEKILSLEERALVCVSLFLCDGRGNVARFSVGAVFHSYNLLYKEIRDGH